MIFLTHRLGEVLFLRLGNRLLRSYLDPALDALQRIEFAFYAMFLSEAWFADLKDKDKVGKQDAKALASAREKRAIEELLKSDPTLTRKAAKQQLKAKNKEQKEAAKEALWKQREEEKMAKKRRKLEERKAAKKNKGVQVLTETQQQSAPPLESSRPLVASLPAPTIPTAGAYFCLYFFSCHTD